MSRQEQEDIYLYVPQLGPRSIVEIGSRTTLNRFNPFSIFIFVVACKGQLGVLVLAKRIRNGVSIFSWCCPHPFFADNLKRVLLSILFFERIFRVDHLTGSQINRTFRFDRHKTRCVLLRNLLNGYCCYDLRADHGTDRIVFQVVFMQMDPLFSPFGTQESIRKLQQSHLRIIYAYLKTRQYGTLAKRPDLDSISISISFDGTSVLKIG